MYSVSLRHADTVRTYSVSAVSGEGWEVKTEENRTLTRHATYRDWHRVERTLSLFGYEIDELIGQGWQVQSMNR